MIRKRIFLSALVLLLFWGVPAGAAEPVAMDSRYVKEHFPEVYREIYEEGRQAGRTEAEAALRDKAPAAARTAVSPIETPPSGSAEKAEAEAAAPGAQSPTAKTATAVAIAAAKPDLGSWWEKNSLTYATLPTQWLFHVQGTLDYKHKTGNTQSDIYNARVGLTVRKQRFTNTFTYIISKELTSQVTRPGTPPSRTDNDYRSIQEGLRYDLTPRLYTEGGYIWEKDTANYISGRNSYYLGIGATLIDAKRHNLEVFLAGGYEKDNFPDLVQQVLKLDHTEVGEVYFLQNYRWNITDRLTYRQTFRIIQHLKDTHVFNDDLTNIQITGETKRYWWYFLNELYFKLTDHLDWMIGYKYEFDSNPWPTVERTDTTLKSGLQFSF